MSLTISIDYACKYRISFAKIMFLQSVEFATIDTKRVIKQTINSRCIGYIMENSNL
jgi:hypothetical protein